MREFWTFIGGVAVGILAVTGVYAMDEEDNSSSVDTDDELEIEKDKENDDMTGDDAVVVR